MTQNQHPFDPNQQYDPNQYAQDQAMQQQYLAQQQYAAEQAAPAKKFGAKQIISVVVIIAIVAVGAWQLYTRFQSNAALDVGKCITLSGESSTDLEHKEVDCADQTVFSYKVIESVDVASSCPEYSSSYTIQSKGRYGNTRTEKVACLVENFHVGVCYSYDDTDQVNSFAVDSTCASGTFKVDSFMEGKDAVCTEPLISWPMPTSSVCFSENA